MKYLYSDFVDTISKRFLEAVSEIAASHNFEYGPEFEIAICKTLRRVLPQQFGICRGYVVNADGDQAGDDIVVFDRIRFPTLRSPVDTNYDRKEQVPIQAVYAYFEAKHTLQLEGEGDGTLHKALEQMSRVKKLCEQRTQVPKTEITPYIDLGNLSILSISAPEGWPESRNPVYAGVIARQVRMRAREEPTQDAEAIQLCLLRKGFLAAERPPDLVIAGSRNVMVPQINKVFYSPFFLPGRSELAMFRVDDVAFGIGMAALLFALDWIKLGQMPWLEILRDALQPRS